MRVTLINSEHGLVVPFGSSRVCADCDYRTVRNLMGGATRDSGHATGVIDSRQNSGPGPSTMRRIQSVLGSPCTIGLNASRSAA